VGLFKKERIYYLRVITIGMPSLLGGIHEILNKVQDDVGRFRMTLGVWSSG
jgi:hypothetical protein